MTVFSSHASIKTTTISVRVIKIDDRQMTLSVFRQLSISPWEYAIQLQPWGWVRYWHEKKNFKGSAHWRAAVFESDGRLLRSLIPSNSEGSAILRQLARDNSEAETNEQFPNFSLRYQNNAVRIYGRHIGLPDDAAPIQAFYNERLAFWENENADIASKLAQKNAALDELGQLFIAT